MRLLLPLFFLAATLALADQVVMKNGDRVTGSIVKKDAANLTIKSVHFGTVTLPWAQIQSVKTDAPLTVVLPDKKSVEGTIASSGSDKIVVKEKATEHTVESKDIVALRDAAEQKAYLRLLHPRLTDLWSMTGIIGLAGTMGNSETRTFTIPINFVRATNNDKITAHFNFIRAQATAGGVSSQTADAIRGGWGYNRNINKDVFATLVNEYEFDRFQALDLRAIGGGGLGWHAWKDDRKQFLDLTAGFDYNHEAFSATSTAAAFTRRLAEFYWGDNAGLKFNKKLSLIQGYRMFNDIGQTGQRQNFDTTFSAALSKHFTWNSSISDHYLTNPPPGLKKNDFIYSTGFGFKFAP